MKKKLLLLLCGIFFAINSNIFSFNIVDRLASPFTDDTYSYDAQKYIIKDKADKAVLIFIVIVLVISAFIPGGRYKRYSYHYNYNYYSGSYTSKATSLVGDLFYLFITLLSRKAENKYKEFSEDYLIKRDNETKDLLKKINFNYEELIKLSEYAFKQFITFLSSEKSDIYQVATQSFYQKYLKDIASLYEKTIRYKIDDLSIENIYIVNLRFTKYEKAFTVVLKYTAREYFIDVVNQSFIKGDRFPVKRFIFLTFIYDNDRFKLSLIENKGESYVMKLENIVEIDEKDITQKITTKDISNTTIQLSVAECFYDIYSYWKGENMEIKSKISQQIFDKIKNAKAKLQKENTILKINDFKISNIELLTFKKNAGLITIGFIVRIKFIIRGSFIKNGVSIISNEEKMCEEIWEFSIEEKNIIFKDIIKKFENLSSSQTVPLQIEWHI